MRFGIFGLPAALAVGMITFGGGRKQRRRRGRAERGCRNRGEALGVGDVEVIPKGYLDRFEQMPLACG